MWLAVRFMFACFLLTSGSNRYPTQITAETLAADSRHFTEYASAPLLDRLVAMPENQNKQLIVVSRQVEASEASWGGMPDGSLRNWLATKTANSDLVAIVTMVSQKSATTADRSFAFSDYEARVDRVFKDNTGCILAGRSIVVTRAGGEVQVNGHLIKVSDPQFGSFNVGQSYLLFLNEITEVGTFKAIADRSFRIDGSNVVSAKTVKDKFDDSFERDGNFMSTLADAVEVAKRKESSRQ